MAPAEAPPRRDPLWPAAVVAAAHLGACLHYFPPHEIFSGEPLLTSDYVFHYLEGSRVADYLRGGSFLGYCTTWAAGFPDGFLGMVNGKPFSLLLAMTPAAARPLAFNLAVLSLLWLFAPLVHCASRSFGRSRREATAATVLALVAWYGSSLFRVFWRGGSVLFLSGTAVALCALGEVYRLWTGARAPSALARAALTSAIVPWIHPGAALIVLLGGAILYAATFRTRGPRVGDVAWIGAATAVANLPWLWPFVRYADLRHTIAYPIYQGGLDQLEADFARVPFHLGAHPAIETAVLLPLLGTTLLARAAAPTLRLETRVLGALAAVLGAITYCGGAVAPLAAIQPYRFAMPLAVILAILACDALGSFHRVIRSRWATALALIVLLLFADRARTAIRASDYLGAGLGEAERWALATLRGAAAPQGGRVPGRVLLEGDWIAERVAGRSRAIRVSYAFVGFESALPAEFIGAPLMTATTWEEAASFWKGKLFGRKLAEYGREAFLDLCDAYDIRWVVSLREETRRKLESFAPEVEAVGARGGVAVFRLARETEPLLRGSGSVRSDGREIVFEAASAQPAVLKYHWNRLLAAHPAAALARADAGSATPAGFIEITPPHLGTFRIGMGSAVAAKAAMVTVGGRSP